MLSARLEKWLDAFPYYWLVNSDLSTQISAPDGTSAHKTQQSPITPLDIANHGERRNPICDRESHFPSPVIKS